MFNGMNGLEILKNWPRFEDGGPVRIGDGVSVTVHDEDGDFERSMTADSISFGEHGIIVCDPCHVVRLLSGERVRRPAPKVLDTDGVEIRVGDTMYEVEGTGHAYKVVGVRVGDGDPLTPTVVTCDEGDGTSEHFLPLQITHRAPALAADGKPLREGETVWDVLGNRRFKVLGFGSDAKLGEFTVKTAGIDGMSLEGYSKPSDLTHERPDSWDRLEKDADRGPHGDMDFDEFARDLVRRAKKLAERDR